MIEDITDEQWAEFDQFAGTPHEFVDEWNRIGWAGPAQYEESVDEGIRRNVMRVRFVTHGWSGNEALHSRITATFFHMSWWASSHRGGLHVYDVPLDQWDDPGMAYMSRYLGGNYDPGSREYLLRAPGELPGGPVRAPLDEIAQDYRYVTSRWGAREIVSRDVTAWRVVDPKLAGLDT